MIITNEPGFYEDFGVRLESVMKVCKNEQNVNFEYLTYIPFEPKLIIFEQSLCLRGRKKAIYIRLSSLDVHFYFDNYMNHCPIKMDMRE